MRLVPRLLIAQGVILVLTVSLPWLVISPVPGVLKVTAPLLCPDHQPDARVVEYSTSSGRNGGTATSATLVCLGPRGDLTEVGSWKPLGILVGAFWLALQLLVVPTQLWRAWRRRGGRDPGPSQGLTISFR